MFILFTRQTVQEKLKVERNRERKKRERKNTIFKPHKLSIKLSTEANSGTHEGGGKV